MLLFGELKEPLICVIIHVIIIQRTHMNFTHVFLKIESLHKSNKTKSCLLLSRSLARISMLAQDIDLEALQHTSTECALNPNQMEPNVKAFSRRS